MNVGDSVRLAIEVWDLGEVDAAMLFACLAVDGTAGKTFPGDNKGNAAIFKRLLRENLGILGPMGMPGIDLVNTRFPVDLRMPMGSDGRPDIGDVIYAIHRCHHGHGQELPAGFELWSDATASDRSTVYSFESGKVRLSDRIIFGLLAVAVMAPVNRDQRVPDGFHLTFSNTHILPINEWWGRAADFPSVAATDLVPLVTLDFGDWMDGLNT